MTDLLRLCYWYYKCWELNDDNFYRFKSGEIREKLAEGLLSNIEQYRMQIKDDFHGSSEEEFLTWLKEAIGNALPSKPVDYHFPNLVSENIRSINSELMLAVLANSNNLITSFDINPGKDHDYDFLVNSIPVQVKTLNPQESAQQAKQKIEELQEEPSTIKEIKSNIVNYLTSLGGLDSMEDAIDQGARIIYLNITHVYLGEICRKFLNDMNKEGHLGEAVRYSVDKAKQITSDLPVIVCVCNSGYDYEVNALCIDIDVVAENGKLKLDRAKLQQFDYT